MSLLSSCEKLKCETCPFIDGIETGNSFQCFLDSTLMIEEDILEDEKYHINCPLLDGKKIIIRAENDQLIIGKDY